MEKKYETISININEVENGKQILLDTIMNLTAVGYECAVREDSDGIYVIDFNHAPYKEFGNATIHWLDWEDEEALEWGRDIKADSENKVEED